ncbi:hypothetical protein FACS189413_12530 [Bacteroidia bacterium]|nr:hypothetical protein FACS189413_12530 [Bacteroidia bacterium]
MHPIERNDGIINICEMKYAADEFVIDKDYDKVLRNKRSAFKEETKTRKSVPYHNGNNLWCKA